MSSFWSSGTGKQITGKPEDSFIGDFSVIPNNTQCLAQIKLFEIIKLSDETPSHLSIIWKITSDDYKGREVNQKIKVFDGKPEQIDRNLNMLKLVMDLCQFKPSHSGCPTNEDLMKMHGKICGIKIREWAMPKNDGSGMSHGNFVAEVHPAQGFVCEIGTPMEINTSSINSLESAFSRNSLPLLEVNDDIPF